MGSKKLRKKLENELARFDLTDEEAVQVLRQLKHKPRVSRNTVEHFYDSKKCKIGIISDTHIGSKYFNQKIWDDAVHVFNTEKVDAIYHPGDIIEGMSNREGHIYELEILGTTKQMDRAGELINLFNSPFFYITGNHDEWSKKKSDQGLEVGPELEKRLKRGKFLGEYEADVKLAPGVTMRLTHEGQTAYALSYSIQKRINALAGGTKPDIMFNGHLHKMLYMFYRNIHAFESGSTQEQTPFARMKGSPSMTGFWTCELDYSKTKLIGITPKMYPYY